LKIALVTDWYLPRMGGLEVHVRDLAAELARRGCEVHVVTPTPESPDEQGWRLPTLGLGQPEGVRVHRLGVPLAPRYGFVVTPGAGGALARLLSEERFDLVHVMVGIVTPASMWAAWLATRRGIPTVVTFHSVLFGFRHVLKGLDLATGWSRWPVVFSAVSRSLAAEAERLVRGRPVHVLPNAVDPGAWKVEPEPGEPGELRLVSVMRLNGRKRGPALLDAVARARRSLGPGNGLRLTVVGDGPQGPKLRRRARGADLAGAVRFTGRLEREAIAGELARADAFVMASVLESFGVAALEARAAGVPVVARACGGLGEFIEHGREGLLAGSDAELSASILRLASEPGLLERLRRGARERPVPFTWAESGRRHLEVYRAVLRGEEPAPLPGRGSEDPRRVNGHPLAPAAARPSA